MTMRMELFDTLDRQLSESCTPAVVRQILAGAEAVELWQSVESSGFLDTLVPESAGGAGLGWHDAWGVLFAAGRHGMPFPFAQTMFARACLSAFNVPTPVGAVAVAGQTTLDAAGAIDAWQVVGGRFAPHTLVQQGQTVYLLASKSASLSPIGDIRGFDAHMHWDAAALKSAVVGSLPEGTLGQGLALALAVQIAGAADRVFEMTLSYSNDRVQFGKPIGRFQAVQQQITEMAERVYGVRMASQLGCRATDWQLDPMIVALAKSQTSAAASRIANLAHAVHGAIGVTHEYDLQLYTRPLYEWSLAGGGAGYWSAQLGRAALLEQDPVDFVREALF
jgi:acyl-CoA dehydrogenase